jgi:hypothetical protein
VCGGCFTYSKCDGDNMSKETTYNSSCPASTGSEGRQIRQIIGAMTNSEHDFSSWTSSLMPGFRSKWRRESDAAATVAAPALVHPRTQLGSGTRSPVLPAKRPCVLTELNAAGSSYLILEPPRGAGCIAAWCQYVCQSSKGHRYLEWSIYWVCAWCGVTCVRVYESSGDDVKLAMMMT